VPNAVAPQGHGLPATHPGRPRGQRWPPASPGIRPASAAAAHEKTPPEKGRGSCTPAAMNQKTTRYCWPTLQYRNWHTPSDFVVDQEASNAESGLYREILLFDNVWTTFCRLIRDPIISIISMAWDFITKSDGIWDLWVYVLVLQPSHRVSA